MTVEASFPLALGKTTCTDESQKPGVLNKDIVQLGEADVEQVGTYVITYRVMDHNGNWNDGNCIGSHHYTRTVVVVDTLKPVLRLDMAGQDLHKVFGEAETSVVTGKLNPAHALMRGIDASQESMTRRRLLTQNSALANRWRAIGVIAAAVGGMAAGVALLAQSPIARSTWRGADELGAAV